MFTAVMCAALKLTLATKPGRQMEVQPASGVLRSTSCSAKFRRFHQPRQVPVLDGFFDLNSEFACQLSLRSRYKEACVLRQLAVGTVSHV
jgi:hypothetical protein